MNNTAQQAPNVGNGRDQRRTDNDPALFRKHPDLREVTQSFLAGNPTGVPGDCVRAAVASLLNLDPAQVPHFTCQDDTRVWPLALAAFAGQHGWQIHRRAWNGNTLPDFGLAIGPSPRGISHAVVVRDGQIAWDPHPSREGLLDVQQVIEFSETGTYTWGESVGMSGDTIDIPLNDHAGNWAATLLIDRGNAKVLRDMLDGVLEETGPEHA